MKLFLTLISICFLHDVFGDIFADHYLNVAIVGYKGKTNFDKFRALWEVIYTDEKIVKNDYCKVKFTEVAYDESSGNEVYNSLTKARATFQDSEVAVAIGPHIDVFTSTAYVISKQIHLITSSSDSAESSQRALPILPDSVSLSNAVADIVKLQLRWTNVAFLSQDDFSPVLALSKQGVSVWPIRLPSNINTKNDPELKQTLINLRQARMDKFILHSMNKTVVSCTISAAEELHLLHHSLSWFITYLDFEDVVKGLKEMTMIFGLQLLNSINIPENLTGTGVENYSRLEQGLLVDSVAIVNHILQTDPEINCMIQPRYNDTISAEYILRRVENTYKLNPYIGALGKYVWEEMQNNGGKVRADYSMGVMRLSNGSEKIANCSFIGQNISIASLLKIETSKSDDEISEILKGGEFKVIVKVEPPFVMRKGSGYTGFCIDVLMELKKLMNFEVTILELSNFTNSEDDITWSKVINQLIVGNASMAIGSLPVTANDEAIISFSYTIMSTSVSLLSKRTPQSPVFFQFLYPFHWNLWLVIVAYFFVVGCALYVMSTYDITQSASEQRFDLKESMWYSLNVILQGGTEYSPQTTSMRTIVAFFWFCTLIIISAYTANLAAFLTLQQIDNRITTIDKLSKQTEINYGLLNNSELKDFFESADYDPYQRMWAVMKLHESVSILPGREEAINRVKHGYDSKPFVFLDYEIINTYYAFQRCDMESFVQNFGERKYGIGFPKGASYKNDIDRAILILKEEGTLDRIKEKWWSPGKNCTNYVRPSDVKKGTAELDLENMLGVFIILIAFSVLAILFEITKRTYIMIKSDEKTEIKTRKYDEETSTTKLPLDGYFPKETTA